MDPPKVIANVQASTLVLIFITFLPSEIVLMLMNYQPPVPWILSYRDKGLKPHKNQTVSPRSDDSQRFVEIVPGIEFGRPMGYK